MSAPDPSTAKPLLFQQSRVGYVDSKWHKWQPHPEALEAMPPKRRTLFRPVHVEGNLI